jgi:thiol-disulfide isomerase/thioredoxin
MPTKSRKQRGGKYAKKSRRRHKVQSTVGNILPPIDVRSPKDIPGFMKRVLAGPVTIVLVYADWCGHCVEFMPKFKSMIRSPERTTQVASIESSMEKQVKDALQKNNSQVKPINVEGYPTTLIMDNKGNSLKTIPRDSLSTVLKEGGPLAEKSIAKSPNMQPPPSAEPSPNMQPPPSASPLPNMQQAPITSPRNIQQQPPIKNKPLTPLEELDSVRLPRNVNHIGGSLYKNMIKGLKRK